jgi:hypothetical protein
VIAPSTLGTSLRAFSFGHARQLDAVIAETIRRAWTFAGRGPGSCRLVIDIDSTIREVHGKLKQGAAYGYTKVLGYHSLLATRADTTATTPSDGPTGPTGPATPPCPPGRQPVRDPYPLSAHPLAVGHRIHPSPQRHPSPPTLHRITNHPTDLAARHTLTQPPTTTPNPRPPDQPRPQPTTAAAAATPDRSDTFTPSTTVHSG